MINVIPVVPFKFFIEFNGEKVEIENVVEFDFERRTLEFIYPKPNTKLNNIVYELIYSIKEGYVYINKENEEYKCPCYLDFNHILPSNPYLINSPCAWIGTVKIILDPKGE